MKKPEMEIVKFHNEDVIATSGRWSERVSVFLSDVYPQNIKVGRATDTNSNDVWMNSAAWNSSDPSGMEILSTELQVYSDTNILDGESKDINSSSYESIFPSSGGGVSMHYRLDSHIGPWDNVYTVWETCGDNCSHCYN